MAGTHKVELIREADPLIFTLRGQRVMLDFNLAALYQVSTGHLNQAFKRNANRFPEDFAFQLTRQEFMHLISQSVISNATRGGFRKLPWAFSEHGAVMLAYILKSKVAKQASIRVVRAFVFLREQIAGNRELAAKFAELEQRLDGHDKSIAALFEAIRHLLDQPSPKREQEIGFHVREEAPRYFVGNRN